MTCLYPKNFYKISTLPLILKLKIEQIKTRNDGVLVIFKASVKI
jgi:hypothetical protein